MKLFYPTSKKMSVRNVAHAKSDRSFFVVATVIRNVSGLSWQTDKHSMTHSHMTKTIILICLRTTLNSNLEIF